MLTKAQKAAYIEALRSGKYKQTQAGDYITTDSEGATCYCAMGLLKEIIPPAVGVAEDHIISVLSRAGFTTGGGFSSPSINSQLARELTKDLTLYGGPTNVAILNDDYKWTFPQFADFFEKVLVTSD